jgi:hypothetical protein
MLKMWQNYGRMGNKIIGYVINELKGVTIITEILTLWHFILEHFRKYSSRSITYSLEYYPTISMYISLLLPTHEINVYEDKNLL